MKNAGKMKKIWSVLFVFFFDGTFFCCWLCSLFHLPTILYFENWKTKKVKRAKKHPLLDKKKKKETKNKEI
jgi:polyferredoxin